MSDRDPPPAFHFETSAFAGQHLAIGDIRIDEAINAPYRATCNVILPEEDAEIGSLLGQDATIVLRRAGVERRVHGLVMSVTELDSTHTGLARARVIVEPGLALARLRRNTRIFQNVSVPDILETVLGEILGPTQRAFESTLTAVYAPREYCVQYAETDLDFVHRLMEEEGIAYTFHHDADLETLVLLDANADFPDAALHGPIRFTLSNQHHSADEDAMLAFHVGLTHTPTSVTVRDFDWTQTTMPFDNGPEGEADANGRTRELYDHGHGRSLSIGDYATGARRYRAHDAVRQTGIRLEAAMRDALVVHARSTAVALAAGTTFELTNHPAPGVDGEYLVTRAVHYARTSRVGAGGGAEFENQLVCIPLSTPYRPHRVTPKPLITSVQPAVVTGPPGEEIHVDEHGRIKVLFRWDRESPADDTSSCWIRVKQEWAGAGWGFWWVPRIGMEVLVHFVDGDPDRPLVTGAVYDADRATPYALPDEKTKSTIKSRSSLGGGGFNEFRFEDKAGSEQIFTHAQKDSDEVVEHDHTTTVHHDQKNEVDGNQTQTVHQNQTERVDVDQTLSVGGNRTIAVEGNYEETVDGTESRTVTGAVTETFQASETRDVAANLDETIGGSETRTVGASQTENIGGSHTLTVSGSYTQEISASLSETITGGITTLTPGAFTATSGGPWTLDAQGGVLIVALGGAQILAPGGVNRVDSDWSLTAGLKENQAAFAIEVYADKLEATGLEIGFCGFKMSEEGTGNYICATKAGVKALWARTAGLRNRIAALVAKPAQAIRT